MCVCVCEKRPTPFFQWIVHFFVPPRTQRARTAMKSFWIFSIFLPIFFSVIVVTARLSILYGTRVFFFLSLTSKCFETHMQGAFVSSCHVSCWAATACKVHVYTVLTFKSFWFDCTLLLFCTRVEYPCICKYCILYICLCSKGRSFEFLYTLAA